MLEAIRKVHHLAFHAVDIDELCNGICRILIESREYYNAWIVLFENVSLNRTYFHKGFGPGQFQPMTDMLDRNVFPSCTGKTLNTKALTVVGNPHLECSECPFRDRYDNLIGYNMALSWSDVLLGWISVAVPREAGLKETEQELFAELIEDISLAVYNLSNSRKREELSFDYEMLLNNMDQAVYILDEDGCILRSNQQADLLIGQIGLEQPRHIWDLFKDRDFSLMKLNETINRGSCTFFDSIQTSGLKEINVKVSFLTSRKRPGAEIYCLLNIFMEKETITKSLFESEMKFQMLFDSSPMSYQSLDEEGKFISVNRSWLETLGYKKEEVLGRWFGDFLHPDYVDSFHSFFSRFKETGSIESEFYIRHRSGEYRYVSFTGKIGKTPGGAFLQTHCIMNDITDKKRHEDELKISQSFLQTIFDNLPSGVVVYEPVDDNSDFLIMNMNKVAQTSSKVEMAAVRGKRVTDVFPSCREIGVLDALTMVAVTGESYYLPTRFYKDSRMSQWVENYIAKLPNGEIVAIYNDVTKEKTLEEEINQTRKMESLGRLAGGIAHDLNNLLTPILAYSDVLAASDKLDERGKRYAETILQAGESASELVSKLLVFSRKKEINTAVSDLNAIIRKFLTIIERTLHENIKLTVSLDENLKPVSIDPVQLEKVLMNLCINAQDAMKNGGEIHISTEQENNLALLKVSDSGTGIPQSVITHIFEPFYSTKGDRGTGLGLSTVYGIVTSLKGTIDVESKDGKGTEFLIRLPNNDEKRKEVKVLPTGKTSGQPAKSILVVEDNGEIRSLLEEGLAGYGYDVVSVSTGKDALSLLENQPFQLVITDIIMPGLDGISLFEETGKTGRDIQFIFMSGYTNDYQINGISLRSSYNFIQKPFTLNQIVNKIQSVF